jgi:ketosteroid isomerase-like protein
LWVLWLWLRTWYKVMMKRFVSLTVLAIALTVAPLSTSAAEQSKSSAPATAVKRVVVPFLHALKRGDLKRMKPRMSAGLYAQYRALFEDNREYGQSLRTLYRDTKFNLGSITFGDQDAAADVRIRWRDGRTAVASVLLIREADGAWKISRLHD